MKYLRGIYAEMKKLRLIAGIHQINIDSPASRRLLKEA